MQDPIRAKRRSRRNGQIIHQSTARRRWLLLRLVSMERRRLSKVRRIRLQRARSRVWQCSSEKGHQTLLMLRLEVLLPETIHSDHEDTHRPQQEQRQHLSIQRTPRRKLT